MDDLLKEAIADAKAVRETALENAKIALEEAFTPRLQSMLSKKIQSEMDVDEQDDEYEDDEEEEEAPEVDPAVPDEGYHEDDEDPTDAYSDEAPPEDDMGDEEPEVDMEGVIEINGVKYAPIVSEEDEEWEDEVPPEDSETEAVDDLDLEAVLRELEEEDSVEEAEEPVDEETEIVDEDDEVDESKEDVDEEVDQSSGIGSSENKKGATDKSSAIGSKGKAKHESVEETDEEVIAESEDIDLEEVIKALSEEDDDEEDKDKVENLQSELDEHRNVVKYLRSKLNEVNLLNAKLLFTNKLFRSFGLTNDQKMKVVENFDRAHNLREVKLVYSTLAESFGTKTTKHEIKEHKGSASKAVASTKSEKQEIIAEGAELRDRFKKLAGIV